MQSQWRHDVDQVLKDAKTQKIGDASALGETERSLTSQYPQSSWAKKASVWKG